MAERLIAEVRQERILTAVRRDGVVTVRTMVDELGAAPMTIRRDINALADRGLVRRVHGGAAALTRRRATTGVRGLTFGMVVPSDHYWNVISYSSQGEALGGGARFMLRNTPGAGPQMLQVATSLVSQSRVDGLILAPPIVEPDHQELHAWLARLHTPTVLVERTADVTLEMSQSVGTDNARGAALAARHLHDLGHRRMAILHHPYEAAGLTGIRQGWHAGLRALAVVDDLAFAMVYAADPRRESLFPELFAQLRDHQVTAVMVTGHPHAVAFAQACHEYGIDVPGELSVVAYGDTDTILSHPPLTAVRPPRELVGRLAVTLLGDHLRHGPDHRLQQVLLAPSLVARQSTAPPA